MTRIRKTHNHRIGLRFQIEPKVAQEALVGHLVGEDGSMIETEVVGSDKAPLLIPPDLGVILALIDDSLAVMAPILVKHVTCD